MNRGWYWRLGLVLASLVASFVVLWPSIPKASTPWVRAHIPFRLNEGLDILDGLDVQGMHESLAANRKPVLCPNGIPKH